jgi:hypothetical protein
MWSEGERTRYLAGAKTFGLLVVLGVFLSGNAVAERLPEPPANCDIAFRLLPVPETSSAADRAALRAHPLTRLMGAFAAKSLGFEPFDFLDKTFDPMVVAAILSGPEGSSLGEFIEDRNRRESWSRAVSELDSLATDLQEHHESTGEDYPKDLQLYLDEVRYYEPSLPPGVDYRYEVLSAGKNFRITTSFGDDSELARLGNPPIFSSNRPGQNLEPTAQAVPLNLVVGVKIKSRQQLVQLMSRAFGPQERGFWRASHPQGLSMVCTLRGDWLVASDRMENLGGFLKSLNGRAPGWSQNPSFQTVSRNLPSNSPLLMFVDSQKVLSALDRSGNEKVSKLLSLIGPIGYGIVPYAESQVRIEVFMGINAPDDSKLKSLMESARGVNASTGLSTANIPWDVANVFALDYGTSKLLLDALIALFPDLDTQYEMGQDVFAGMLGIDAETGFNGLFEGAAVLSFERIDILLNALEAFMETKQAVSVAGPREDEGGEPEEAEEPDEPPKKTALRLPATVAVKVPVEANQQTLISMLKPFLGDEQTRETLYGVEIVTGADGLFSYAVDGDWFYISGGRTVRLMRRMLEASHGRRETLASIDSWSRFTVGTRGKLLAFGHQKMDAFYSLAKGFILLLGSDFRPIAMEVGKLRDYHSVMTLVPDGLLITGEIVQGDGR